MTFRRATILSSLAAAALLTGNVHGLVIGGDITTGVGNFVHLPVPLTGATPLNTVGSDNFNSPHLFAFNESQNVLVASPGLTVNIGSGGFIPAGTVVASHYVFFDPVSYGSHIGYVDFDAPILGVAFSVQTLAATDYLGAAGVTYTNPGLRGIEDTDFVTIDGTLNYRVNVDWAARTPGDYIRVLTAASPGAAVPDSGSTLCLIGGVVGVALVFSRKLRSCVA